MDLRKLPEQEAAEILRELIDYNPDTGVLTWKPRDRKWFKSDRARNIWFSRYCNKQIEHTSKHGYIEFRLWGVLYSAHRVVWLHHYGEWPKMVIDHINRIRNDNRICNLRDVDECINAQNQATRSTNTSGVKGVMKRPNRPSCWYAEIKFHGERKYLGSYKTFEEAVEARKRAELKYFKNEMPANS